jgi:type II secretory pathway component PulK
VVTARDRRGAALLLVLGLLVVLGGVAAEVARIARLETALVQGERARTVARFAAEAGVVAARVRVEQLLDSLRSYEERPAAFRALDVRMEPLQEVALGDARFGVAVVDLNARLDLNRADAATLRAFLAQFAGASRADAITAALKEQPLWRLSELAAVPGVDAALAREIAPYVTLSGDGIVNVNSAPEPVLAALGGLGEAGARSVVARREAGELFTTPAAIRPPTGAGSAGSGAVFPAVSTMPTRLLVVARGWRAGHPLTHEVQAVFSVAGQRLVLQGWRERDL